MWLPWLRILLALAFWIATTTGQQCGVAGGLTKIVGGSTVGSLKYPWYVAFVIKTSRALSDLQVNCGGALITSRHVLSAAHCFPRTSGVRSEDMYQAVLGLVNRCTLECGEKVAISRVRINPSYNTQTLKGDISIVTLARTVSYTPVCLPPKNYSPSGPALIIGYGSTLVRSPYPCTLQEAIVQIFTDRECARSSLSPEFSHIPGTLCAGIADGGVDSCDGDSGGPLMTEGLGGTYFVQGVVSFGEGCARKNLPGVYTKVSSYRDFIDSSVSREASTRQRHTFLSLS